MSTKLTQAELLALISTIAVGDHSDPELNAKVDNLATQLTSEHLTNEDQQVLIEALVHQLAASTPPALPVVSGVAPITGAIAGGETVTLTGTGFTGATAVSFGAVAATSFSVVDDTSITAVSPAQDAATVNVTVTTPAGVSVAGVANEYVLA